MYGNVLTKKLSDILHTVCIVMHKRKFTSITNAKDTQSSSPMMRVYLPRSQMYRRFILWSPWYCLLQILQKNQHPLTTFPINMDESELTSFSNTQVLRTLSGRLHCHSCWLFISRQFQWLRNAWRHDLLMSSRLVPPCQP